MVRRRLPFATLKGLSLAGLSEQEIERFVIPQRTRRHRAEKIEPLTVEEPDRDVRFARIQSLAEDTFGDPARANGWLSKELGGETPLTVVQTDADTRRSSSMIIKRAAQFVAVQQSETDEALVSEN